MRRLYQKIYLTIVVSLLVVVAIAGAFWRAGFESSPAGQAFELAGELAAAALPPPDAPAAIQRQAVEQLARRLDMNLALYAADRSLTARAGRPPPGPPWPEMLPERRGFIHGPGGPVWGIELPDGRALVAQRLVPHRHPAIGFVLMLAVIALVVAACAYPVVRGLTRRLERLQAAVETVGAGDLAARVTVKGRDEIARLAESFNRAAARIEELVNAHRLLLANASHELRTPLSRIRLGVELFQEKADPKYKEAIERDIRELDELIDEILLASRLDATRTLPLREEVDLLALVAEECARYDIAPQGEPASVRGDPRLLRRLVRNLLENARRHGRPPVRVALRRAEGSAVLDVMDAGEGIPEAERERVFAPFHRLRADGAGTGLGLALVRQIARLHGGDAALAPQPDAPVCFRVTLPETRDQ
jgi:signal transduction histidine kinase